MDDFFKGWGDSSREYWAEMKTAPGVYWLYLPMVIFAIWALAILLRIAIKKSKYPFKTVYTIHRRIAISSALLATVFVLLMIYWWSSQYYDTHPVRLVHLFSFFLLLLVPVISLLVLRGYYRKEQLRDIAELAKTSDQQKKIGDATRKGFNKVKLWGLFVVIGFLGLTLWGFKAEKNLVSILLDNSPSMEEAIRNGKIALGNTFKKLNPGTNVVLTTFTMQKATSLPTYDDILAFSKFNVVTVSNFFESPAAALDALNAVDIEGNVGSPISQGIWENYQFVQHSCPVKDYKNVVLLIITDGIDNISQSLNQSNSFFCQQPPFNELYPAENIRVIDVKDNFENGNSNSNTQSGALGTIRFFEKASKCGYDIQSGKELEDYGQAVEDALKDFKKDWWLIIWVGAIYLVYLLSLIIITPPARS
jgi:cytochrome b561